jgi:hypothetical protein
LFNSLLCNFLFECYKEPVSGVIGFPLFICWFGNGKGICLLRQVKFKVQENMAALALLPEATQRSELEQV